MKKLFVLMLAGTLMAAAAPGPTMGKKETQYMSRAFGSDQSYDVQVSTVMRTYAKDHKYMPLIIQVHNQKAGGVQVSPERFVLKAKSGEEYKPISTTEYLENHKVQGRRNIKYLSHRADTGIETKNEVWYIERSRFYPLGGDGGVYDQVSLRPNFYMIDFLYFPQLESGEYELVYTSDSGEVLVLPVTL